jgi:hypothetical protein
LPTCSEIVEALNTLAEATTNPNMISDLTGLTASFSVPYGEIAKVQLSAGGDAVLSVPEGYSVDGKPFKITVSGFITQTTAEYSDEPTLRIWNGTNLGTATILSSVGVVMNSTPGSFVLEFYGFWDSTTQFLLGSSSPGGLCSPTNKMETVTSQSGLQFVVSGQTSGSSSDPGDTMTITKMTLELI